MSATLDYHLLELDLARNPDDPRHCLPDIAAHERDVLDIGCGIGQFFVARDRDDVRAVGIDVDREALAYGAQNFTQVGFLCASGNALPFAAQSFDLVISRVSLPYMDIPRALDEMRRVLRPGGRLWLTLHPVGRTWRELGRSLRSWQPRDVVYRGYVLANGLLLHSFGRCLAFPRKHRFESFQTGHGMRRLLRARGFDSIQVEQGRHFMVVARKAGATPASASAQGSR